MESKNRAVNKIDAIEDAAAAWLLRRDSGAFGEDEQRQLSQWLDSAVAHRVAFLRLELGWEEANRLKALGAGFPRGKIPSIAELAIEPDSAESRRGRGLRLFALVAALLGIGALSILMYTVGPLGGERYTTPVGGLSSVPLKDGSNVTLNTASRIRVRLSEEERRVELVQGEAFFDVAKDAARPFVVEAGDQRIVAVGTNFSVRRDDDDEVRVVVTEGEVRLDSTRKTSPPAHLKAGGIARVSSAGTDIEASSATTAQDLLSWRSGYVVFRDTALAEAVAEFNRYNERQIVIEGSELGALRLTGKFRANNFEAFVRLLEESFPVRSQYLDDRIILRDLTSDTS